MLREEISKNMICTKELPTPEEIKKLYPMTDDLKKIKEKFDQELRDIFTGKSDKFVLVIGPCSADREDSVMDYLQRLRKVADEVSDVLFIVPRVYTNKPRTTGAGYKGMLHQPDPTKSPDMLKGIVAIRKMHMDVIKTTGFCPADEMLYPENYAYMSDVLSYIAVGARSVEDQQHRMVASSFDVPTGMKNPTSGDMGVLMNSIWASQNEQTFIYRGWEAHTLGNDLAHAVLRGYVDETGRTHPNYHYEDLAYLAKLYKEKAYKNPAVIIDTNHSNSGKNYLEQIRISKEVLHSTRHNKEIYNLVKGLMIESYIEDGCQKPEETTYGKSITDPCLGWEKTEKLIRDIAELRRNKK